MVTTPVMPLILASVARGCQNLALLHGPPGTGKTHTIAALVRSLVLDGESPLALADSNAATDHLAVRIAAAAAMRRPSRLAALIRYAAVFLAGAGATWVLRPAPSVEPVPVPPVVAERPPESVTRTTMS